MLVSLLFLQCDVRRSGSFMLLTQSTDEIHVYAVRYTQSVRDTMHRIKGGNKSQIRAQSWQAVSSFRAVEYVRSCRCLESLPYQL